jgi:hypothetical protein
MIRALPGPLAAALLALARVGFGQSLSVEIIPASTVNVTFPALRDGLPGQIESRSLQLRTTRDGSNFRELVVFRDPATGTFLSKVRYLRHDFFGITAEAGDLLPNTAISIDKGTMRAFFFVGYSMLISESTARAASLDAAQQRALSEFVASVLPSPESNWWVSDEHWIRLLEHLPTDIAGHVGERRPPPTRIRELARSAGCWSMILEGQNAESTRTAIDDSYDLVSIESCAKPRHPVSHIVLPPSERKVQVSALRNNLPTTLEIRSTVAQATFPDGQTGRISLLMFYDPRSRLFWWTGRLLHPSQPDSQIEHDNQDFLRWHSIFVTDDRIAVFTGASVTESTERYPDLQTAKAHVVSVLERIRGNLQAWRPSLPMHVLDTGIPGDFFYQCGHAEMAHAILERVERVGRLWRLRLSGANGNSAVLSLKENYERADVQLSGSYPCYSAPLD